MIFALLVALLPQTAAVQAKVDPVGTWTMSTTLNDEPGTMKLVIAREKGGVLIADVTTLMGATVRARSVNLKNDHLTIEAEAHEGMVLTFEIDVQGDKLTGKWVAGEYKGALKGERAPPADAADDR